MRILILGGYRIKADAAIMGSPMSVLKPENGAIMGESCWS